MKLTFFAPHDVNFNFPQEQHLHQRTLYTTKMPSVLLVVFVVQLLLSLISTVGASAVNDLAWYLFTLLPTPQSSSAKSNLKLRADVVRLEREMRAVSAQDEFAKWAKIRRQHDKAKEKYEKEGESTIYIP